MLNKLATLLFCLNFLIFAFLLIFDIIITSTLRFARTYLFKSMPVINGFSYQIMSFVLWFSFKTLGIELKVDKPVR